MARARESASPSSGLPVRERVLRIESLTSVLNNAIRWGGAVLISYFAYRTVGVLAGETTSASIGISVLADVRISEALAWIFGGSAMIYGWRQRKLRKDTTERLSKRSNDLEKRLDPKRSSSSLTPRGDTNPRDKR